MVDPWLARACTSVWKTRRRLAGTLLAILLGGVAGCTSAVGDPSPSPGGPVQHESRGLSRAAGPIRNPSNGHFYEWVESPDITWTEADKEARQRHYQGLGGYLATITSEAEDDFLFQHFGDRQNAWIGASDAEVEGEWRWAAGPDKGLLFWRGDSQGSARGFAAWRTGEPNNSFPSSQDPPDEDYATWKFANEGWNDLPNDPKKTVFRPQAYLVEYSPAGPSAAQEHNTESWSRSPRPLPPDAVTVVDNETLGYYNDSLGTVLDGTEEVFLLGGRTGWEPRFRPAPEPRLTAATKYLGAWLKDDPLPLGPSWSGPKRIPPAWPVNTETAIIYPFVHRGPQHLELVAEFCADNGFFVWLDGEYKFGSIERGGTRATVPLGAVPPGKHFIQVLRVDHGVVDGYRVRIVGRPASPSGAAGRQPPSIPREAPGKADAGIELLLQETQKLKESVNRLTRSVEELAKQRTLLEEQQRSRGQGASASAAEDTPEQRLRISRAAEADLAAGLSIEQISRKLGVSEPMLRRWLHWYRIYKSHDSLDGTGPPSGASSNLIRNGGFEQPDLGPGWHDVGPGGGSFVWKVRAAEEGEPWRVEIVDRFWQGCSQRDALRPDQTVDIDFSTVLSQDFPTEPGRTYELRFWYAHNPDRETSSAEAEVRVIGRGTLHKARLTHDEPSALKDMMFRQHVAQFAADSLSAQLEFEGLQNGMCGFVVDDVQVVPMVAGHRWRRATPPEIEGPPAAQPLPALPEPLGVELRSAAGGPDTSALRAVGGRDVGNPETE